MFGRRAHPSAVESLGLGLKNAWKKVLPLGASRPEAAKIFGIISISGLLFAESHGSSSLNRL